MKNIIVICGLIGTGKTTIANYVSKKYNYKYIKDFDLFTECQGDKMKIINDYILENQNQKIVIDVNYQNYEKEFEIVNNKNTFIMYLGFNQSLTRNQLLKIFKNKTKEEINYLLQQSKIYKEFCKNRELLYFDIDKNRDRILLTLIRNFETLLLENK
ncbi:MAG: hypothetical protein IJW82_06655 [Clostridia bacterium]|nr:hypothetical protein [Clostridia bacterium]